MRITYHGPHDGVELAALTNVVVARGQTIEVDDELGASLIEQSCWDAEAGDVAAWVGDDQERAARLLVAETNGANRADLIARLDLIANPPPDAVDVAGEVPSGTAEEVLAWVGDDVVRANRALMAELSGRNRAGLTAQLERLSTGEEQH